MCCMLWLTKIPVKLCFLRSCTKLMTLLVSLTDRWFVGPSRISSRDLKCMARAIATPCRWPTTGCCDRARQALQVTSADPRRANEPSVGQGNQQGHQLRAGPQEAEFDRDLRQPQHAAH